MSLTSHPNTPDDHEEYLFWLQTHTPDDKLTWQEKHVINLRYAELADRMEEEYEIQKLGEGELHYMADERKEWH